MLSLGTYSVRLQWFNTDVWINAVFCMPLFSDRVQSPSTEGRFPIPDDTLNRVVFRVSRNVDGRTHSFRLYCISVHPIPTRDFLFVLWGHSPTTKHSKILEILAVSYKSLYLPCWRHDGNRIERYQGSMLHQGVPVFHTPEQSKLSGIRCNFPQNSHRLFTKSTLEGILCLLPISLWRSIHRTIWSQ